MSDKSAYWRAYGESRRAERVLVDGIWINPNAPHGEVRGYKMYYCECQQCRDAFNKYQRDYYARNQQLREDKRLNALARRHESRRAGSVKVESNPE